MVSGVPLGDQGDRSKLPQNLTEMAHVLNAQIISNCSLNGYNTSYLNFKNFSAEIPNTHTTMLNYTFFLLFEIL